MTGAGTTYAPQGLRMAFSAAAPGVEGVEGQDAEGVRGSQVRPSERLGLRLCPCGSRRVGGKTQERNRQDLMTAWIQEDESGWLTGLLGRTIPKGS